MPPKKPRQSEPVPSPTAPAAKKVRTSLPARIRSSPTNTSSKRKPAGSDDDDYDPPAKPTKAKYVQVKKKVKMDVEVDIEGEVEEDEEIEEVVENPPAKKSTRPTVKEIANAAKKSTGPSKAKNTRRESSRGEDKIGEIYAAGNELLSDTSVKKRSETITKTLDKLEKQLHIPADQLKKLCFDRSAFFMTVDALHIPIIAILEDRAEFQKTLVGTIKQYESLPARAADILSSLDRTQKAAIESGLRIVEDSQDFDSFTRGAKRIRVRPHPDGRLKLMQDRGNAHPSSPIGRSMYTPNPVVTTSSLNV